MTTLSAAGVDARNVSEPMEECTAPNPSECTESQDRLHERDSRDKDERHDIKETREREKDIKESRDTREPRDVREKERESRELIRDREPRESRDTRDHREVRDGRETRDLRDLRDLREAPEASPPRISPLLSVRRFRTESLIEISTPTHPPIPKDEPPDEPMRSLSPEDDSVSIRSNGASESIGKIYLITMIRYVGRYMKNIQFFLRVHLSSSESTIKIVHTSLIITIIHFSILIYHYTNQIIIWNT